MGGVLQAVREFLEGRDGWAGLSFAVVGLVLMLASTRLAALYRLSLRPEAGTRRRLFSPTKPSTYRVIGFGLLVLGLVELVR